MKNKLLFLFVQLSLYAQIFSQSSDEDIHRKYWYYKSHLNNDFLKIGTDFGESIPFNEKKTVHSNSLATISLLDAPNLHAGDGSARLGIYLSVLATEYRLLKNNGQDVSKIKHEIFCALNAINRLDLNAETYFDAPAPQNTPNLDGFFVRDDIRKDFVSKNYNHFNYFNKHINNILDSTIPGYVGKKVPITILQDHGFTKTDLSGVYRTTSSWNSAQTHPVNNVFATADSSYKRALLGFEESMDQAFYLLMGLTLTSKLVDIGESDNGAVFPITATPGQISLRNEAKEIATRIIQHMSGDPLFLIKNTANKLSANPALVQSLSLTVTSAISPIVTSSVIPLPLNNVLGFLNNVVQTGGWPAIYSYGLDNLGNFIKNGQSLPYVWIPLSQVSPTSAFPLPPLISNTSQWIGGLANYPFTPSFDFRRGISVVSAPLYMALMNSGGGPRVDFQGFTHTLAGSSNTIYDQITLVNIAIEADIATYNLMISLMPGTNADLNRLDSLSHATFPSNVANTITSLINAIKAAKLSTNPQVLNAAISTGINYIWQLKKLKSQLLYGHVLKNVTDERLFLNSATNPVFYHVDSTCAFPTNMVHIGSDQLFGIYLRDILHPLLTNPPSGFRWLNTLAAPSRFIIKNTVKNQLALAPCNGNFNFGTSFMPPDPWGSSCTMDRFDAVWKKTNCIKAINKGEYSGLDFMLLHNLFYLTEQANSAGIKDYIDRDLTDNFPLNIPLNGNAFTQGNNQTFGAFEFIRASNVIAPNGQAIIRAGKQVTLLPGFSSQHGSDVKVKVEPFHDCDWNTSTGMLRNSSSNSISTTGETLNSNYIYDSKKHEDKKTESNKESSNYKVSVYPNPNEGSFNIQFNLDKKELVKVNVINVLGERVYENELQTINDIIQVQLPHVTKGMYLVTTTFENGHLFQKRIVTK